MHQQRVLANAAPDAVVGEAQVHAVVRLVERLEAQEGALGFGQRGELSVLLFPNVGRRPRKRKERGTKKFKKRVK